MTKADIAFWDRRSGIYQRNILILCKRWWHLQRVIRLGIVGDELAEVWSNNGNMDSHNVGELYRASR
jgi:hypothetical protein